MNNPHDEVDTRVYELTFIPPTLISFKEKSIYFTQRELRLIMKHTENRNSHIFSKIKCFIEDVDNIDKRRTDFNARVPKTHVIRVF